MQDFVIVLDERGQELSSTAFAAMLAQVALIHPLLPPPPPPPPLGRLGALLI